MKILELPVSELKNALTGFNKVVNTKSPLPALGCIRIEPQAEEVHLQVTDLDSFATCRLKATASPNFPVCLLSMASLAKVAKTAKGSIALIHEDNDRFKLRHFIGTTPVEQSIESCPIEDWPPIPQVKAKQFLVEPGFKEAFRHALGCASSESTRLILNGVCLDIGQPDCHCLVATDGRHLFSANTFHFPLSQTLVIPDRGFLNWSGFGDDGDWLLAVDPPVTKEGEEAQPAHVQLQSQRWTFVTRGIDGQYPDWRQIMPRPDRTFTTVKLTDQSVGLILDALPRMPGGDEASQPVTLVVRPGRLILRSRSATDDDWTEIPVSGVSVSGADQRVSLDRSFISKALRFGFSEFEVADHLSPVLFVAPGKKMLAAPMRLDDAPASAEATSQPAAPSPQPAAAPTEAAQTAHRPPPQPHNPTEENTAMATSNNITTLPAPERGNLKPTTTNGHNGDNPTAMKAVVEAVERIKTNLRDVIGDLNDTLDLLKAAEKEKKATLKEVESVRATLRSLQKVEL